MSWLLTKIIESIIGILANLGSDWAKGKLRTNATVEDLEKKRLKKIRKKLQKHVKSLKPGRVYFLHITMYGRRVEELLSFVRNQLCDGPEVSRLIGTSTVLPSAMIKLSLYRVTWLSHAEKAKQLFYKCIRVVCASHEALRKDVESNESLYNEFFKWCNDTKVEVRVFNGDYATEMRRYAIDLQDYMLFVDAFVFGSRNPITEDEIKCQLIVEDDALYGYKQMANAALENSTEIKDLDELNNYLNAKL